MTEWGREGGGRSAGTEEPGLPVPDQATAHRTPDWTLAPSSLSYLQRQRGAVDISKVAFGGLCLENLLSYCTNGLGDPVSLIGIEVRLLQTDEGQACHGHCVCNGQSQ